MWSNSFLRPKMALIPGEKSGGKVRLATESQRVHWGTSGVSWFLASSTRTSFPHLWPCSPRNMGLMAHWLMQGFDGRSRAPLPELATVIRGGFAEFIAMTLFIFFGCGAASSELTQIGGEWDPAATLMVALQFGFAITVLAYATAHASGGHINCAVTWCRTPSSRGLCPACLDHGYAMSRLWAWWEIDVGWAFASWCLAVALWSKAAIR